MVKTFVQRGLYADCIYEQIDSDEVHIKKIVPYPDIKLFEIRATYIKRSPSASYYILATSKREAKRNFLAGMNLPIITGIREITSLNEADVILSNPDRTLLASV